MSALKRKLKNKRPPEGWELIEEVIEDFEQQLKDAVNEDHEGKRVAELTWKIHRLHWEKNRFIFDLMYKRKVMSRELVRVHDPAHASSPMPPTSLPASHAWDGLPHGANSPRSPPPAAQSPCSLLKHHAPCSPDPPTTQYDWLVREKVADGALIAKWRKPGYELLCSMLSIQKGAHNFGTTSHCRVPLRVRAAQQRVTPNVATGCISCASGDGRFGGPIW